MPKLRLRLLWMMSVRLIHSTPLFSWLDKSGFLKGPRHVQTSIAHIDRFGEKVNFPNFFDPKCTRLGARVKKVPFFDFFSTKKCPFSTHFFVETPHFLQKNLQKNPFFLQKNGFSTKKSTFSTKKYGLFCRKSGFSTKKSPFWAFFCRKSGFSTKKCLFFCRKNIFLKINFFST